MKSRRLVRNGGGPPPVGWPTIQQHNLHTGADGGYMLVDTGCPSTFDMWPTQSIQHPRRRRGCGWIGRRSRIHKPPAKTVYEFLAGNLVSTALPILELMLLTSKPAGGGEPLPAPWPSPPCSPSNATSRPPEHDTLELINRTQVPHLYMGPVTRDLRTHKR